MRRRRGATGPSRRSAAAHPPIPTRKISETILEFGAPVLDLAPPSASRESLREALTIVITI